MGDGIRDHIPKLKEVRDGGGYYCVAQQWNKDNSGWTVNLLLNLCEPETVEQICKIQWPASQSHDKLLWKELSVRKFSVKECCELSHMERFNQEHHFWKRLCNTKIHDKLRVHIWRILADVIPRREVIKRRINVPEVCCVLENRLHIFKECSAAGDFAFSSKWGCRIDFWSVNPSMD